MKFRFDRALAGATALLAVAVATQASAQVRDPLSGRGDALPAAIARLDSQGVRLTYLGDEGGLRAYLGESANGRMQTFYLTPDGNHVVTGVLFSSEGTNVTGIQIAEMRARFDAASRELSNASIDVTAAVEADAEASVPVENAGDDANGVTAAPETDFPTVLSNAAEISDTSAAVEEGRSGRLVPPSVSPPDGGFAPFVPDVPLGIDAASEDEASPAASPIVEDPNDPAPAGEAIVEPAAAETDEQSALLIPSADDPVEGDTGPTASAWLSDIDRDAFVSAAENTSFFEVGSLQAVNEAWFVADPRCPFSQATWDALRPLVYSRDLRVRIILVAGLEGSEAYAAEILSQAQPARAWLDADAGRNVTPSQDQSGPEFVTARERLSANMSFAEEFNMEWTPFLAYVGEDGELYASLGQPSDVPRFLSAFPGR